MSAWVRAVWAIGLLLAADAATAGAGLTVSYLVEARSLRNSTRPGDLLTFELYADAACTRPVHRERLAAMRVTVWPTHVRPVARMARAPRGAALEAVLHPGAPEAGLYLVVRGPGVRPLGDPCQAQGSSI